MESYTHSFCGRFNSSARDGAKSGSVERSGWGQNAQTKLFRLARLGEVGAEVGAASSLIQACCADDHEFLAGAQALGMDSGRAADRADGEELGDLVSDSHEVGDGVERLGGVGGIETGDEEAFALMDEIDRQLLQGVVEELCLVDADDVYAVELRKEIFAQAIDGGDRAGLMGLGAVAGDGGAMVAEIDVRLVADDALTGDAGSLEAADELFALAGEHGAGDDLKPAWVDGVHG